ncbi:MAG: ATP-dependent zinc metalloprotease FtsH [Desulfobacterales bacterium]
MKNDYRPRQPNPISWGRIVLVVVLTWLILGFFFGIYSPERLNLSYTAFKEAVQEGRISEITVKGQEITGEFDQPLTEDLQEPGEDEKAYRMFKTVMPAFEDTELMPLLEANDIAINAEVQDQNWISTMLIILLPWILIIGVFVYANKKLQERMGGAKSPFNFGKSKAKLYKKTISDVKFGDVSGLNNAKKELQEIIDFLKDPKKFKSLGGELPKGILLIGPPGVGKTLMARAVSGEAEVPFFSISGSEFIEMFVGVGASRVRDMFNKAKAEAPSIIFVDELDSIGRVRGTGVGGGHDEREQTLNQILSEMDGFAGHESVVVLAATNRPDVLDPALVRPGRFDRRISLNLPRKEAREEILALHTRDKPIADNVNLEDLARRTVGFSGADLKNLTNEAALLAARRNKTKIEAVDFDNARDKIIMGIEREDIIREEEKEVIAYHEAGHALAALFLPDADPLEKVSIIPRGRSLGATEQIPEEDRYNLSRKYLLSRIGVMLAGRAAEKLMFDDVSTGAGDDLKKASDLARRMVCQWGMSDKIGPVAFRRGDPHPFLGREMTETRDFSEQTACRPGRPSIGPRAASIRRAQAA